MNTQARVQRLGVYAAAILIPALCAAGLASVPVVAVRAVVPVLLLIVLLLARTWGTRPAVAGSASASVAYTHFFLPFSGTFATDAEHWISFASFTLTAIVVGELAGHAEQRQLEAERGQRRIEELYRQLSAAFERASEAEAARRADQMKATLLDALTHNLRTPLTSIKASVTALMASAIPEPTSGLSRAERGELLQVIDEESDRLNRFVDGLSVADRPDPTQRISVRTVQVESIVSEALARAGNVLRRHVVELLVAPDLPPLAVDPAATGEVMFILLDNASKYTPEGTTIRIAASQEDDHHLRVVVADEGPGIPEELRERVFEKFYRIPGRDANDWWRTGLGLGLSIARRLAESQAGCLWIDTPPSGCGVQLNLVLPVGADSSLAPDPIDKHASVRAKE